MGVLDTVKAAWQAGAPPARKGLDPGVPASGWVDWWYSPAAWMDQVRQVGDGSSSSIVQATLRVLVDAWAEPPPVVWEPGPDGQPVEVDDHPLPALLLTPNPEMTVDLLWHYYVWATRLDGNAYLWKARNAAGRPVELWPLRPDLTTPIRLRDRGGPDTGRNIDAYSYRPHGQEVLLDPADVVHLRIGLDPYDHSRGMGPVKTVLKEIVGDEAAAKLIGALLSNMGIPGVVLAPDDPTSPGPSPDEAEAIGRRWRDRFSGDKAGRPLILSGRLKPVVTAFTPEQLDVSALRRIPEERIPAVCGVPSILAGMGAGLKASSGRSESITLLEAFTERTMIPDWARVGRQLTRQLLPDFEPAAGRRWVGFRLRDVRALAEDEHKLWERVDKAVRSGWLTVAEAKTAVGLRPQEGDDVYLRPVSVVEVQPGVSPTAAAEQVLDAGSP